jgi:chromosome segregation ATPase
MITVYDIIIIIVIVLIITPLIISIIITSRRPKFGRFDTLIKKIGSGPKEEAEINELNGIVSNINDNLSNGQVSQEKYIQALTYIEKSQPLITKLKTQLDEYGKPGVIPISKHESIINAQHQRHQKDFSDLNKTFQEQLNASQAEINRLTLELARLRVLLVQNNAELVRLRHLDERNKQPVNVQLSGNTKEIKQYQDEIKELRANRKQTSDINEQLKNENNTLKESNKALQTHLETLEKENKRISADINNFITNIKEIHAQNNELEQIIHEKNIEILQLKQINEIHTHATHHHDEVSDEYDNSLADDLGNAMQEEFQNSNNENTKLQETIQSQQAQLEQLTKDIDLLRSENYRLNQSILELQAKLKAKSEEVEELKQQNEALKQEIGQCRNNKDQVGSDSNQRLYELIKENKKLVNELDLSINETPPPK